MTQFPSPSSFLTTILTQVSLDRLQKAVTALADGSVTITLARQTDAEMSAYVANGDGKTYSVTLTEGRSFCSCPDAMYRGTTCKHLAATALTVLRTPAPQQAVLVVVAPLPSHLAWTNGAVLCHTQQAARVNIWPWSAPTIEDACPDCVTTYQRGYNSSHMIHLVA